MAKLTQLPKEVLIATLVIFVIAGVYLFLQKPGEQPSESTAILNDIAVENATPVSIRPVQPTPQSPISTASTDICVSRTTGETTESYTYLTTTSNSVFLKSSEFISNLSRFEIGNRTNTTSVMFNVKMRKTITAEIINGSIDNSTKVTEYILLNDNLLCYQIHLSFERANITANCPVINASFTRYSYCLDNSVNRSTGNITVPFGTFETDVYMLSPIKTIWLNKNISVPIRIEEPASVSELFNYTAN